METIIRHVRDMAVCERSTLESLVGHGLRENQKLIIQVVVADSPPAKNPPIGTATLPDWCNVYEGLSDEDIAEVEKKLPRTGSSDKCFRVIAWI